MKITKSANKEAKLIFQKSLVKGKLDQNILKGFVNSLVQLRSTLVLAALLNQVELYEKDRQLVVESAYKLSANETKAIYKYYENFLQKDLELVTAENRALIAGVRIKNGDFVWENTVLSNLNQLKGAISK